MYKTEKHKHMDVVNARLLWQIGFFKIWNSYPWKYCFCYVCFKLFDRIEKPQTYINHKKRARKRIKEEMQRYNVLNENELPLQLQILRIAVSRCLRSFYSFSIPQVCYILPRIYLGVLAKTTFKETAIILKCCPW